MKAWIIDPWAGQAPQRQQTGGKAVGLEALRQARGDPPRFLAITADAFDALSGQALPAPFMDELRASLQRADLLGKPLAVRSSALSEDGDQASYAGIFESVLNVNEAGLESALNRVWDSARSERALAYAKKIDPQAHGARMGVIIQAMVNAQVSGVAFTADPVSGDRGVIVISAVKGLGEALVSGELSGDTWHVQADGTVQSGTTDACLKHDQVRALAVEFKRLESALGGPQDLEWALDQAGKLRLLQARPITKLPPSPRLWDNANIVESYGGITLPLTFSFAQAVYEQAYLVFSRFAGVPESVLQAHPEIFSQRLGLKRGRVYYDLINWYRNLALLPFYRFNKTAMEAMMGVAEALPQDMEPPSGLVQAWRAIRVGARLVVAAWRAPANERAFHALVDSTLLPLETSPCAALAPRDLAARFELLWERLLLRWQTPIVHDVFAMASLGIMQALLKRWKPGLEPGVTADLLRAQGSMSSAEPARRMQALARQWQEDPALRALFSAEADNAALWACLQQQTPAFHMELRSYLSRWGLRCEGELKLETVPLDQDPPAFLQILRSLEPRSEQQERGAAELYAGAKRTAVQKALADLSLLQRIILGWSIRWANASMLSRENLRFERTRAYGEVRRIFLALGARMHEAGALAEPRDVFYLELPEALAWAKRGSGEGLKSLVSARKADFAAWSLSPAPPPRFKGEAPEGVEALRDPGSLLQGLGACAGLVRGRAKIVRDPARAGDLRGRIMVAERTDPGWTLIFPQALGLAVERGSLLSHSAVVARELGLPCVVGVPDLLRLIQDGELLELNGARGTLRRLEQA